MDGTNSWRQAWSEEMSSGAAALLSWCHPERSLQAGVESGGIEFAAGEGYEADWEEFVLGEFAVFLFDEQQVLNVFLRADGDNHAAAVPELFDEHGGDCFSAGGDHDGVERCFFRPAVIAVAVADVDIAVAQFGEALLCFKGEWFDDFDRIDLIDDFGEDGGLVA